MLNRIVTQTLLESLEAKPTRKETVTGQYQIVRRLLSYRPATQLKCYQADPQI